MPGIISLANIFSVGLVMSHGRVSLAHLMEFSNFLDLYVLEEEVYVDDSSKCVFLEPLLADKSCPIRSLPLGELSYAVGEVDTATGWIYDGAPTNFSFHTGSYAYWTTLTDAEKAKVSWPSGAGVLSQEGLLASSKYLSDSIGTTLEHLAKTTFTLVPSFRNLLPFLACFHQIDTPALKAYREVAAHHRIATENLLSLIRPRLVYIPPLLALLLSRCEARSDIPSRMVELRAEFAGFRKSIAEWFARLDAATSLRDKFELSKELESANQALTSSLQDKKPALYKELTGVMLDAAADGDLKKMITKPAFALLKAGMTTLLPERLALKRYTGMVDLMDKVLDIENYSMLLERVFGNSLDISQGEITHARQHRKTVVLDTGLDILGPG
jgi:hypothetical protein